MMRKARLPGLGGIILLMAWAGISSDLSLSAAVSTAVLGSLEIATEPGTIILWDGDILGVADESGRMSVSDIPPGGYSITFRRDGLEDWEQGIEILPGTQDLKWPPSSELADSGLPDPFARQSLPVASVGIVAVLVAVAAGAWWLGRRRREEPEQSSEIQGEGPRVVLAREPRGRRNPPGFYEDLRQRETVLEDLEERGSERARPKIIEIPLSEHQQAEGDS